MKPPIQICTGRSAAAIVRVLLGWLVLVLAIGTSHAQVSITNSTGTNGAYADANGDGWSNYQEWQAGTNPPDTNSVPGTNVVQTAPIAAVLASTNLLGSLAIVTNRLWDGEGNSSTPFLQFQLLGSTNWQEATLAFLDGAPYSTNSRVAAPPGGTNHIIVWDALTNLGAG
jgi:hypothetical protein